MDDVLVSIQRGYTVRALCRDAAKAESYLGKAVGLEVL